MIHGLAWLLSNKFYFCSSLCLFFFSLASFQSCLAHSPIDAFLWRNEIITKNVLGCAHYYIYYEASCCQLRNQELKELDVIEFG